MPYQKEGVAMVDYEALGRRLKSRRQAAKLSQEQLAQMTQISLSYYGNIERGKRIPSVDTLVTLANVLEVSMDYLLVDSLIVARRHLISKLEANNKVRRILRDAIAELDYSDEVPLTQEEE